MKKIKVYPPPLYFPKVSSGPDWSPLLANSGPRAVCLTPLLYNSTPEGDSRSAIPSLAWNWIVLKKSRPHRSSSRNHYVRTYPSAASALQKSSALRPVWEDENKTAITTSQEYPAWITRRPPGFQLIFLFRSAFYSTDVLVVVQL